MFLFLLLLLSVLLFVVAKLTVFVFVVVDVCFVFGVAPYVFLVFLLRNLRHTPRTEGGASKASCFWFLCMFCCLLLLNKLLLFLLLLLSLLFLVLLLVFCLCVFLGTLGRHQ